MCAKLTLRARIDELVRYFLVREIDTYYESVNEIDQTALPGSILPVITCGPHLRPMRFSVIPSWSPEKQVKFATHNARFEGIETKPTWKKIFLERHCVVPMSFFLEPAYRGPLAGNWVRFEPKAESFLGAAGIWDEWVDRKTGEVIVSFAILTREPSAFIHEHGHDRTPVFLPVKAHEEWLSLDPQKGPAAVHEFLKAEAIHPELKASADLALKAGWPKKIKPLEDLRSSRGPLMTQKTFLRPPNRNQELQKSGHKIKPH